MTSDTRRARALSCRFHGRAWSKTCEECNALLDAGAMAPPRPPVILAPEGSGLAWIVASFLIAAAAIVAAVALVVLT